MCGGDGGWGMGDGDCEWDGNGDGQGSWRKQERGGHTSRGSRDEPERMTFFCKPLPPSATFCHGKVLCLSSPAFDVRHTTLAMAACHDLAAVEGSWLFPLASGVWRLVQQPHRVLCIGLSLCWLTR